MNVFFTTNNFSKWFDENYYLYLEYKVEIFVSAPKHALLYKGLLFNAPYRMITLKNVKYDVGIFLYNKTIYIDIILSDIKNK